MNNQQNATPPTMLLQDGQTVTIRPIGEDDHAALLAFGVALPPDDMLYLEDDFQDSDIIMRLVNARFAENWRQFVAATNSAMMVTTAASPM